MFETDRVETHFSGGAEAPELEDYHPISPLVIGACIAGLASVLAIVHPLLWVVPVVAAILSICAIIGVSAAQSRYSGRSAAVVALCVAALIGTYAPARSLSRERAIYTRAQAKAEEWLSLIQQGRVQEAHQFTLGPSQRFKGPGPLAGHYLPPPPTSRRNANSMDPSSMDPADMMMEPSDSEQIAAFLQEPVTAKLVEYGKQASIEHLQDVSIGTTYGNVAVTQRFKVSGVSDGQPGSFEFLVTSTRWEALEHANWQVGGFKEVK